MKGTTILQSFWRIIVGHSEGSGIALLYVCLGVVGFLGCCLFRRSKNLKALD